MKKPTGNYVVVFVTAASHAEARRIARAVVTQRLAACVNICAGVESHYRWRGKIEEARECLLIMKTERRLVSALTAAVKQLHSYEVPEIIALPITAGSKDYLKWITESLK
jgi:periplasmic divalent cation tolerance protein